MKAVIKAIASYLPEGLLTNEQLAQAYPEWTVKKIHEKTGVAIRHIVGEGECASDLGVAASRRLFAQGACLPEQVDFLLFCTQSPDYFFPTTACLMQERLGLPTSAGALDFNLGCSGFIYGLGLAKGLVESGQATNVLLVTAETYSRHIHSGDKSARTIFGDAGAATLVGASSGAGSLGPFVYGTDGRGGEHLIVRTGGMRQPRSGASAVAEMDDQGNTRSKDNLYMNGPEIFTFTLRSVPKLVASTLERAAIRMEDVDFFVFHQANQYMLESLRRKIKIPKEKFEVFLEDCGNTVSCSIPIALRNMLDAGRLNPGHNLMLVGFGVGYSWGATLVRWD